MKIKRWMILTALFTFLGGTIVTSGCQTSNTASTTNGGGAIDISGCIDQCTQDCTDSCTESCNESCSNCQLGNGTYDCTDPAGCVTCWFDCNTILCYEICSGLCNVAMNRPSGGDSTNSESQSQSSSTDSAQGRTLIEGVDYTIIYDGVNILFYPLKDFSAFYYNLEVYNKTSGQMVQGGGAQHLNVQKNKYIFHTPNGPSTDKFDAINYASRIIQVTGVDATSPIEFEEDLPDTTNYSNLVEGVDYTMEIDMLTINFKPSREMSYIIYYETYEKSTGKTFTEGVFYYTGEMSFHPFLPDSHYDEGSADKFGIRILAVKGAKFGDDLDISDSESSSLEESSSGDMLIEDSTTEDSNA